MPSVPPPIRLEADIPPHEDPCIVKFSFGAECIHQLRQYCSSIPATLAVVFLSTWLRLHQEFDWCNHVGIVGVPFSERPSEAMHSAVGNFIRILAIRSLGSGAQSWEELVHRTT